jgi:NAD(P)-dependent dehydrogenase (short-subunit alcohol dehydrogenase family)
VRLQDKLQAGVCIRIGVISLKVHSPRQCRKNYQPWVAYGQSKLANVLFTYELARRLPKDANCTVNALHPGVVDTELARYLLPDDPPFWQVR